MTRPLLLAAMLLGCATVQPPVDTKPVWIAMGSGADVEGEARYFTGVGQATRLQNAALRRKQAENEARAELRKVLDAYTSSLINAVQRFCPPSHVLEEGEELAPSPLPRFVQEQIAVATITDVWLSEGSTPIERVQVVRVRLSFDAFRAALLAFTELSPELREKIRAHADRTFQLVAEESPAPHR